MFHHKFSKHLNEVTEISLGLITIFLSYLQAFLLKNINSEINNLVFIRVLFKKFQITFNLTIAMILVCVCHICHTKEYFLI